MPLPPEVTLRAGYAKYATGAIYRRLLASEDLRTMCKGGIYVGSAGDRIGRPVPYPYLLIGDELSEVPDDALTNSGRTVFITLKVVSTASGPEESQTIAEHADYLLDHQERTLNTTPWRTAQCVNVGSQIYKNPDNTYEHTTRYRLDGRA